MNDLPGRGDVNPYGIPVPNPHEQEGPDEESLLAGDDFALDELERLIGERRCQLNGHPSWSAVVSFGSAVPAFFICDRCGFSVATKDPGG